MVHAQQQLCYSKIMCLTRQGKKGRKEEKRSNATLKDLPTREPGHPSRMVLYSIFVCNSLPH